MKKKKYLIGVLVCIIGLIIVIWGSYKIYQNMMADQAKTEEQKQEFIKSYQDFNEMVVNLNQQKNRFPPLFDDVYYTTLKDKSSEMIEILNNLQQIIHNMHTIGNELDLKCSKEWNDSLIRKNCESYKTNIAQAEEILKEYIKKYNHLIESYEEWRKENQEYPNISKFE
ncbi:MAG: hypothetical protein HFH86_01600 [Bacilli bacterium]|nr:hypothetical protein [Bacilli bacterium]